MMTKRSLSQSSHNRRIVQTIGYKGEVGKHDLYQTGTERKESEGATSHDSPFIRLCSVEVASGA
ncbi:hypothetical protein ccbrp13_63120 [Ktedonobacteria bacterium brp13]|nr:hypothetical protein ccbrp13_63120 [Ktedonobacteria bacterium brp13]